MGKPVLLVQWLDASESGREVSLVAEKYSKGEALQTDDLDETNTPADLLKIISDWRSIDSQFLYIGSHGVVDDANKLVGIGPNGGQYVPVGELATTLCTGSGFKPITVWLGGCYSSQIVDPFNAAMPEIQPKVIELVAFDEAVSSETCAVTLEALSAGILGVEKTSLKVHGISVSSEVILSQDVEKTVQNLRDQLGEFAHLELFRAMNGKTLSKRVPKPNPTP